MTQDECVKFVQKGFFFLLVLWYIALSLAIWRDGSSGGVARIGVITPEQGIQRMIVPNNELMTYL